MATIGVKIELEGAPQYKENMSNLKAQTKLYQSQLKSLSSQMGSNVSAFKKSITESKALEQVLDAQKNQLKLLDDQIAKTTEKYGEDSTQVLRLKTEYQNLSAAIAQTTADLEAHGGTLGAIGAEFEAIGNKISAVGEKVSSVGDKMTTGLTAPIVAVGAAATKAWSEVDDGMDTIIKKTGATGEALEELQGVAKDIATTIPTSFDAAGSAVGEVNTRFGVTGDELKDLSTKFIEFANLNGTDVSSSIDSVQAAMAAFGVAAEDAGSVLDILNKAGQDSGISMDSLSNALLSNATTLTEVGFDINEAAGFIANLEKNGVDSSAAMAGLKKAFTEATKEGKTMDEALAELQTAMSNAGNDTEAYQAALELFGNKAGPAIAKAVQEGRLSFEQSTNAIKDYSDSVAKTFDATQDPIDEFQTNMNKIKLVGEDLVNTAAPMISQVMEKMAEVIQKVTDAWNGLDEEQQQNIIKIAAVVAAVGPVLSIVGRGISLISKVFTGISSLMGIVSSVVGVISTIGTVLTATIIPAIGGVIAAIAPFLPVIVGVGAAIAAVVLIVRNWGDITDWITEKWNLFTTWLSETFESLKASLIEGITAGLENIKTLFTTGWENIKLLFSKGWEAFWTLFVNANVKLIQKVASLIQSIKDKFTGLMNTAKEWGSHLIENFINGIKQKWEDLKNTVGMVAETIKQYLGFSVPEKGPLHFSNQWPTHFMENYSQGIEAARYLVKDAVAEVAQDVTVLANPIDSSMVYDAVRMGASNATISLTIGDREFKRSLRGMGVSLNGN